jgi:hypothetical protein
MTPMKFASLLVCTVALTFAASAQAQDQPRKKVEHKSVTSERSMAGRQPGAGDYRELLADKMKIGSTEWWEQMRREGRLGGETP